MLACGAPQGGETLRNPTFFATFVLLLAGCGSSIFDDSFDDSDPDPPEESDPPVVDTEPEPEESDEPVVEPPDPYLNAYLVVYEPVSASIYTSDVPLHAQVFDANDQPIEAEPFSWTLARGAASIFDEAEGEVALDPGTYDLTAQVDLPNGDRLRSTIGGVRVQDERAGVYVGELAIASFAELQGQTVRSDCVGSLDFVVDAAGETLAGSGGCTLTLPLIGTFDLDYDVDGEIDGVNITGNINFDAVFFSIPLPWEGGFPTNDTVEGRFEGDIVIADLEGTISARRVTRYLP